MIPLMLIACKLPPPGVLCEQCALWDENNFQYDATATIETIDVAERQDIRIDWSSLSQDMLGQPLSPEHITAAAMVVFGDLSTEELSDAIARDAIPQSEVDAYLSCTPQDTHCMLSDFNLNGYTMDIEEDFTVGQGTWLVSLISEDEDNAAYRQLLFISPTSESTTTTVDITNKNSALDVDVDFASLTPLTVPEANPVSVDWGNLTQTGLGTDLPIHKIDRLDIAHYTDLDSTDLTSEFVALENLYNAQWSMPIDGTIDADLSELSGPDGSFSGFSDEGLWLLALRCGTCTSPMPLFLTVVSPAEE